MPPEHHRPSLTAAQQSAAAFSAGAGLTQHATDSRNGAFYLYIFSFDGVLANSARIYLELCHGALTACGHTRQLPSLEDLVRCERFDGHGLADAFGLRSQQREDFVFHISTALSQSALRCDLYPGVALALKTLARTAYTAVVSRSSPDFIATALRANGVPHAINRTLGIDCGNPVDCVRQLLREMQIAPRRAVYCGDCVHDLHVARLAGVQAAACTWGWQGEALQATGSSDHLVFNRPAQMLATLAAPYQTQPDIVL